MEACATGEMAFLDPSAYEFQNRKRYGGMRDKGYVGEGVDVREYGFKTVNGMEACATVALKSGLATR